MAGSTNSVDGEELSSEEEAMFCDCERCEFTREMRSYLVNGKIRPYQFEPLVSDSVSHANNNNECGSHENDSDSWKNSTSSDEDEKTELCPCKKCNTSDKYGICCKSLKALDSKLININCITKHKGFLTVCTHPEVLQTAYATQMDLSNEKGSKSTRFTNKILLETAIKQFQTWVYKVPNRPGNDVPSCVLEMFNKNFYTKPLETESKIPPSQLQMTGSGFSSSGVPVPRSSSCDASSDIVDDFTAVVRVNKSGNLVSSCVIEYIKDEPSEDHSSQILSVKQNITDNPDHGNLNDPKLGTSSEILHNIKMEMIDG